MKVLQKSLHALSVIGRVKSFCAGCIMGGAFRQARLTLNPNIAELHMINLSCEKIVNESNHASFIGE